MMISNFCHDTNHYHLVRLYDVVSNSATTDSTQLAIIKLLQSMQAEIKELKENKPLPLGKKYFTRTKRKLYCWTHGLSNHKGYDCTRKAQGRQDDATGKDHKGE